MLVLFPDEGSVHYCSLRSGGWTQLLFVWAQVPINCPATFYQSFVQVLPLRDRGPPGDVAYAAKRGESTTTGVRLNYGPSNRIQGCQGWV